MASLVAATQIAVQAMRKRGGGVIVNTVSTVALGTGFYDAMYATTQAAVMMFTRCCAPLKDECNVRVAGMLPVQIGRAVSELPSLMRLSYAVFCLQKPTSDTP